MKKKLAAPPIPPGCLACIEQPDPAVPRDAIRGVLMKKPRSRGFQLTNIEPEGENEPSKLSIWPSEASRSFFTYLARENIPMLFWGKGTGPHLEVHDMAPSELDANGRAIPAGQRPDSGLFRWIVERLARRESPEKGPPRRSGSFIPPRSPRDLEMVFAALGDALPPDLRQWAALQMDSLKRDVFRESPENGHIRRGLAMVLSIDWDPVLPAPPSDEEVRTFLDRAFYGLEPVKRRFREVMAQIRYAGSLPRYGILLSGPAGTGKTAIAMAMAKLLGMPVIRLDLSTVTSGSEIAGTGTIYHNAKPGRVMEGVESGRSAGAAVLINELDKAGRDKDDDGSIADALLSLLDGQGFVDNFLGVPIPTDRMFFLATCNDPEEISAPLRSRFLRIDVPACSAEEKEAILERHVLPRALAASGLPAGALTLAPEARQAVVREYAPGSGVRDLEQVVERLVGDYLLRRETQGDRADPCWTGADLRRLLGPGSCVTHHMALVPGMARGLALWEGGAAELLVQAAVLPGNGELEILGVPDLLQRDAVRTACYGVQTTMAPVLAKRKVVVSLTTPAPPGCAAFLGLPAFMAVCSAVQRRTLSPEAVFVGGADLMGNLFFASPTARPVLSALSGSGHTLYGPAALEDLLSQEDRQRAGVNVVTSLMAEGLYLMASGGLDAAENPA